MNARTRSPATRGALLLTLAAIAATALASPPAASADASADPTSGYRFIDGSAGQGTTPKPVPDLPGDPYHTLVSHPDFLNADVGDVSTLPTWDGASNSWNNEYAASLDVVLGQFAAEQPDDVLVAGDLVEGHWGQDVDGTGIFGPVDTTEERLQAVKRAGEFYFGRWRDRFLSRGLPLPHITVGDHEIGDNPWPFGGFKWHAVPTYKETVAEQLIGVRYPAVHRPVGTSFADTSYWTELHPRVMLVSVDVFRRFGANRSTKGGAVAASVAGDHLRWFSRTLARGRKNYDWVIVQAHTPVITPVRSAGSSLMQVEGGVRSTFWKAMVEHHVDLFLAGEVHQVMATERKRGPVQLTHGGLFSWGRSRYVRIDVFRRRLELSSYGFDAYVNGDTRLWQTSSKRSVPSGLRYVPGRVLRGSAVLDADGRFHHRTGDLAPARELGYTR